jgi:hypothetical protein
MHRIGHAKPYYIQTKTKEIKMQILTTEVVQEFVKGAKSLTDVTAGLSTELMNEAINLFIVESALNILKFSAVFVVFYIVKRYIDVMMNSNKEKEGMFKALKTCALIGSIIFFTAQSFPHIQEMTKALVAPKIFLLEKGASLIRQR